jgi:hypothetical protein
VNYYVLSQPTFGGKTFSTNVTFEWFNNIMILFSVFNELVAILEEAELAVTAKTPVDSRRLCVVTQHVILQVVSFHNFTAQMTCAINGEVHMFLVRTQKLDNPACVRTAGDVAGEFSLLSVMLLHVTLQQEFKIKNCAAHFTRNSQCSVVLFSVFFQHHGR